MIRKTTPRVIFINSNSSNEVDTIPELDEEREHIFITTDGIISGTVTENAPNRPVLPPFEIIPDHTKSKTSDSGIGSDSNIARKELNHHNEMENEYLLLNRCNGDLTSDDASIAFSGPEKGERRATLSSPERPVSASAGLKKQPFNRNGRLDSRCQSIDPLSSKYTTSLEHLSRLESETKISAPSSQTRSSLDADSKSHPKYGSTLSNIGVEYMKATGAIGVRFKQLQKPQVSNSLDSVNDPEQCVNDAINEGSEHQKGAIVMSLCNDLPIIVPMDRALSATAKQSIDIEKNSKSSKQEKSRFRSLRTPSASHHVGYRLGQRKTLAELRRKVADYSCLFALLGLLFMIIETECSIPKSGPDHKPFYNKTDIASYVIKGLISLTTLVLLVLIGAYHAIEVQLFVVDNCIEDWRISMSWRRVLQIATELTICAVHPVPGAVYFNWTILDVKTGQYKTAYSVPIDIFLSLPMFIRLYLIVRVLLLHSKLFTDASSRSIGALNKITFNTRFVLKTLMNIFPGTVLVVFMMSLWIIFAWTLRACESYHDRLLANLLNCLYMVAITFLSVGYGDLVPYTYCGRTLCVLSGLMGAGCTALVVAVIAKKLELTRAEKHVHNFMMENQLSKKLKDAAANVLRETWLIYKHTKLVKRVHHARVRAHQRKFLTAISDLRKVKLKQRKLADQSNSLTDFAKTTSHILDIVSEMRHTDEYNEERMNRIDNMVSNLKVQIEALPNAIASAMMDQQLASSYCTAADDMSTPNSPQVYRTPRRRNNVVTNQASFDSMP